MTSLLALILAGPALADLVVLPTVTESADALAARVAAASGDPYREVALAFTFVVTADGQEKARRRHIWCPQAGRVEVRQGERADRISAVDGSPIGDTPADQAQSAWGAFINDSYWLLAPSKVMDVGVVRSLDAGGRLALAFAGVGLTPGDRYLLDVDRDTDQVWRWSYTLQSGRTGEWRWEGWQQVGGLHLSTLRVAEQGDATIRFEEVQALASCPL